MILRQYRLQLEYVLTVEELTDGVVIRDFEDRRRGDNLRDPETWKRVDRQRRLLALLTDNPEILDRLANAYFVERICDVREAVGAEIDSSIFLLPLFEKLPPDDRDYFSKEHLEGFGPESLDEFYECFKLDLIQARVIEVKGEFRAPFQDHSYKDQLVEGCELLVPRYDELQHVNDGEKEKLGMDHQPPKSSEAKAARDEKKPIAQTLFDL